jgi:hypothetical protein
MLHEACRAEVTSRPAFSDSKHLTEGSKKISKQTADTGWKNNIMEIANLNMLLGTSEIMVVLRWYMVVSM